MGLKGFWFAYGGIGGCTLVDSGSVLGPVIFFGCPTKGHNVLPTPPQKIKNTKKTQKEWKKLFAARWLKTFSIVVSQNQIQINLKD